MNSQVLGVRVASIVFAKCAGLRDLGRSEFLAVETRTHAAQVAIPDCAILRMEPPSLRSAAHSRAIRRTEAQSRE
jgi:hypothetical protein